MRKLLIGYNYLLHYRKPLFNELAKTYDVTVLHSGKETLEESDAYKELIVPVRKIGPFYFQWRFLKEVASGKYDAVVTLFDVAWLTAVFAVYLAPRKTRYIWWGAWKTRLRAANAVRVFFSHRADANIYYTEQSRRQFEESGVDPSTLYVANNTFHVGERIRAFENTQKDTILFVGSLDQRKQNDVLLRAFSRIGDKIDPEIMLRIVGSGAEEQRLRDLVKEYVLEDRVVFEGRIEDPASLRDFYRRAFVCVCFGQAGLSVLQSFGYGVPFLTKHNAISGGEITNIRDGFNGILCGDNEASLEEALLSLCQDIEYSRSLGRAAHETYEKYCTIENMAQGFKDAIEGVRLERVDTSSL